MLFVNELNQQVNHIQVVVIEHEIDP